MRFRLLSQWGAIFAHRQFNCIEFTVIHMNFDFSKLASRVLITIGLMGVNLIVFIPVGLQKNGKLHLRMRDREERAMGGNFIPIEEATERLAKKGIDLDFEVPETLVETLVEEWQAKRS